MDPVEKIYKVDLLTGGDNNGSSSQESRNERELEKDEKGITQTVQMMQPNFEINDKI